MVLILHMNTSLPTNQEMLHVGLGWFDDGPASQKVDQNCANSIFSILWNAFKSNGQFKMVKHIVKVVVFIYIF